ncbi:MAG: hydroxymyristoyl-ACP dehydratase [Xanthomonadales bacterium]|nr:hydroxymyristoyl-ACP dehydratase [Xanthomonadales bacterium]ODU91882.1 MAG: hypothetical protein ABT18_14595 [Rhodanobacter sp. SCN 66-43]OJY84816.1 MAG: hypothetical protein BGP23_02105 [Xanthomonadales bacterium 66-474]
MNAQHQTALRIEASHPALAGHFPGNPVVPGVVLLERVAAAWKAWRGTRASQFDAKFVHPLLPDEDAVIELREDAAGVRFSVLRADGTTLVRGTLGAGS